MTEHQPNQGNAWWGTFDLPIDGILERRIGPLELIFERGSSEWRVSTLRQAVESKGQANVDPGQPQEPAVDRYATAATRGPLRVFPVVANRPVVTEPVSPLHVEPSGRVTLYLSTPLWYRIEVGDPPVCLRDDFIVRPSDTWFGPSTREGELCYASRTSGRLELADVPIRPERALTAVTIINEIATVLPILRLNLPAPYLDLYADSTGMLWTQDVELDNREEDALVDLKIDERPPVRAANPQLVSAARNKVRRHGIFRAFGAVFR